MTDEQKTLLIKLAGEMVLCKDMPPYFDSDWDLPKSTPQRARREIAAMSQIAHSQCLEWARRLKKIVDDMEKTT